MELTKLYVIKFEGKTHYFTTESDSNIFYNRLPIWARKECELSIINLMED
jgi:hypothetical protein